MKKKDIALIVVIAIISGIASLIISTKIFVAPKNRQQEVQVVDPISSTFVPPSNKYFNGNSVNTETPIQIGDSNNQNPFDSTTKQ